MYGASIVSILEKIGSIMVGPDNICLIEWWNKWNEEWETIWIEDADQMKTNVPETGVCYSVKNMF